MVPGKNMLRIENYTILKYVNRQTWCKKKKENIHPRPIPGPINAGHYPANRLFFPAVKAEIGRGNV
jgi:hypothetical protein